MLRSRSYLSHVLLVLWAILPACGPAPGQQGGIQGTGPDTQIHEGANGSDPKTRDTAALTLETRAEQIVQRATSVEPSVTPVLVALVGELGGELYKLEYRLKTLSSTIRKLDKEQGEHPDTPIAELDISDSLRYTIRIDDNPLGSHVAGVKRVLLALEEKGYKVIKIKNYWPKGDNYSGVNGILEHPSGLHWELQFHTTRSIQVNADTREWYEELREVATPLPRKRSLFQLMAGTWEDVPVPQDIMIPQSLHALEEIRKNDPP